MPCALEGCEAMTGWRLAIAHRFVHLACGLVESCVLDRPFSRNGSLLLDALHVASERIEALADHDERIAA